MGLGGRSICPPGRKVVPSNTEGRFRLDKPAPATVRCPRGGGRQERQGLQVSQELPGRGPRVPQARPVGAVVGWGRWGRCAPASPGTAAWTQTACRWCVLVSILCPPVHDMLKCPQFPSLAPPDYPPTVYPYWGTGCLVFCAMARAETFRVCTLWWYLCAGALQRAARKMRRRRWWDILGSVLGHWRGGEGAASGWPP